MLGAISGVLSPAGSTMCFNDADGLDAAAADAVHPDPSDTGMALEALEVQLPS